MSTDQENQIKYPEEVMFQWCTFAIFNLWKKEKQSFSQSSPFNVFSIDFMCSVSQPSWAVVGINAKPTSGHGNSGR